jgi:hypothetical protein
MTRSAIGSFRRSDGRGMGVELLSVLIAGFMVD